METLLIDSPAWQVFLLIGMVLSVMEIFIPGFVLLPIGLGFMITAPFSALTRSFPLQLIVLSICEVAVFLLLRYFVPGARTLLYSGAEGMIGQECEVVDEISASKSGYVRLYGDRWQARTYCLESLPVGSRAVILKLDGNKVLVEPIDSAGGSSWKSV